MLEDTLHAATDFSRTTPRVVWDHPGDRKWNSDHRHWPGGRIISCRDSPSLSFQSPDAIETRLSVGEDGCHAVRVLQQVASVLSYKFVLKSRRQTQA